MLMHVGDLHCHRMFDYSIPGTRRLSHVRAYYYLLLNDGPYVHAYRKGTWDDHAMGTAWTLHRIRELREKRQLLILEASVLKSLWGAISIKYIIYNSNAYLF